jgi:VWFA-related protein
VIRNMPQQKGITRREILLSVLSMTAGNLFAAPQQEEQTESGTFSVNVDVVNVFVTVRDKKGQLIKDLAREDFTVKENGRVQNIQYFARESDLPLAIGLMVDTTPSEASMLDEERNASRAFLNRIMRPDKDRAFLIQYHNQIELLQWVTSSRDMLDRSLNRLEGHSMGIPPETILADAIEVTSAEIMRKQEGRKALILLGDGGHVGNRLVKAITAAQMADTLIYGILIYDRGFQGAGGFGYDRTQDKINLHRLSDETGGAFFEVTKKTPLDRIYGTIEEELRSQYSLGYARDAKARKGFRTIKVEVRKRGLVVRSRHGYYPGAKLKVNKK